MKSDRLANRVAIVTGPAGGLAAPSRLTLRETEQGSPYRGDNRKLGEVAGIRQGSVFWWLHQRADSCTVRGLRWMVARRKRFETARRFTDGGDQQTRPCHEAFVFHGYQEAKREASPTLPSCSGADLPCLPLVLGRSHAHRLASGHPRF